MMTRHWPPLLCAATVIEPLSVYLTALDSRLSMIVSHMSGSMSAKRLMAVDDQVKPGPRAQLGERRGDLRGQRADIGAHQAGGGAARFDTGELQQRVDQAQQPPRVTPGSTQPIRENRLRTHVGERIFQRSEQQRQRSAEFVADIGQKRCLGAVQFGQRIGPLPLLLVRDHCGQRRGQLVGEQLTKAAVLIIQRAARIDSHHQRPRDRVLAQR